MRCKPDVPSRRIAYAIGISVVLHGLALWGPDIRLAQGGQALPPLQAKLEALPEAPATAKPTHPARPAAANTASEPAPELAPPAELPAHPDLPPADSAPVATETPAAETPVALTHSPLPQRAQLTFAVNKGMGGFRVGEAIHTLEIDDGHYLLQAVTRTVGLVKLFMSYELTQSSSGSYNQYGLQPEQFFEQRKDKLATLRNTAEFDHTARRARFSNGGETTLPPDMQDILSVMYQFPLQDGAETAAVSVSNGKKIERYEFAVEADEQIDTPIGKLLTVRLSKLHAANQEGLEIWLAREYRLFPVKMRFIEKNGEVSGEAVITDIRVSEEQGVRSNAVN